VFVQLPAGIGIPDADGLIVRGRHDLAIRGDVQTENFAAMGFRRAREFLACLQIEMPRGNSRIIDDLGASAVGGKLQIPGQAALPRSILPRSLPAGQSQMRTK